MNSRMPELVAYIQKSSWGKSNASNEPFDFKYIAL